MPFGLEQLSDGQRKALTYGAPAVAAIVLGTRLAKPKTPAATDPAAAQNPPAAYFAAAPATGAIGVSQLANFESGLSDALANVQQGLSDLVNRPNNTPPMYSSSDPYEQRVINLYRAELGREPDPAGLAFWSAQLRAGHSVAEVAAAIHNTDEGRRGY
jgi:hypothetical protein